MDEQIRQLQRDVTSPENVVAVGIAFDFSGRGPQTVHGVTVLGPRKKKLSSFIVASPPYPNTPAGALRTLADLMEAKD